VEEQQLKDFKAPPSTRKAGLLAINIREKLLGGKVKQLILSLFCL
jgi:hypothetical protein